jgi:hypothetical protein
VREPRASAGGPAKAGRSGADPPPRLALRAGPLTAEFEPQGAFLRWVRVAGREVVRGVYAAVRDGNWNTVEPVVRDLAVDVAADRFTISFTADCRAAGIDFSWEGRLDGDPAGRITYRFLGTADRAFASNRIGFCVLHPLAGVAGRPCRVAHVDGSVECGTFPGHVAAWQPFRDIRAITFAPGPDLEVTVRMSGDTFEMEDQRNWTDASFKTYCRPLSLPFPFAVNAGDRIDQTVEIQALRFGPAEATVATPAASPREVTIDLAPAAGAFPAVGIGLGPHPSPAAGDLRGPLARLAPRHLRIDLRLKRPDWREALRAADDLAVAAGLEIAVHLEGVIDTELAAVAAAAEALASPLARVLVFHATEKCTPPGAAAAARRWLARHGMSPPVAIGTDAFFAELNRGRPDPAAADVLTFSINPQVHAFDDTSIVETIEAQEEVVRSARALAGGKPVVVSPVTLRMRSNPNATAPVAEAEALAAACDPRQSTRFTAAWTVGSLRAVAAGGAAAATYYELAGPRGILDAAGVFPVYHVLADVCGWPPAQPAGGETAQPAGGETARFVPTRSSAPLEAEAVGLVAAGRLRLLVANLEPDRRRVVCRGLPPGRRFAIRVLDADTAAFAATDPAGFRRRTASGTTSSAGGLAVDLDGHAVATLSEEAS